MVYPEESHLLKEVVPGDERVSGIEEVNVRVVCGTEWNHAF